MFSGNINKTAPVLDLSSCTDARFSIYRTNRNLRKVGGFKNINNKLDWGHDLFRECYMLEEFPSGLFQDFNSAPGYISKYVLSDQY